MRIIENSFHCRRRLKPNYQRSWGSICTNISSPSRCNHSPFLFSYNRVSPLLFSPLLFASLLVSYNLFSPRAPPLQLVSLGFLFFGYSPMAMPSSDDVLSEQISNNQFNGDQVQVHIRVVNTCFTAVSYYSNSISPRRI